MQARGNALCVLLLLVAISLVVRQSLYRQRIQDAITCKANLKSIATAAEMYSTDCMGRYPQSLKPLVPLYLKVIPTCPRTGCDSYSATFQSRCLPDLFTIDCQGDHRGVPAEYTVKQTRIEDQGW
jgi:hypothetical protein